MSSTNGTCAASKKSNIVSFKELSQQIQDLLTTAKTTRSCAYCPYSNFQVGAAVLCQDGSVFSGCNVENVSFTVGICAERVAYSKAISEGKNKFTACAVVAKGTQDFVTPCGACRQFISEFDKVDIYLMRPDEERVFVTNSDVNV